jgi:hypothetical protein
MSCGAATFPRARSKIPTLDEKGRDHLAALLLFRNLKRNCKFLSTIPQGDVAPPVSRNGAFPKTEQPQKQL